MADNRLIEDLYRDNFPRIYNFFFYRLLHRENAEDLTEVTFLKAVEHIDTYNADIAKASTWLQQIAQNTLIDFYRTQKKTVSFDDSDMELEVHLSVSFEEQYRTIVSPARKELYKALSQLSERDRTMIYYKYILGKSYHEIAEEFQMNESTLATVLQRARQKLGNLVSEDDFY